MENSLPLGVGSPLAESCRSSSVLGRRDLFIAFATLWLFLIFVPFPNIACAETIPTTSTETVVSTEQAYYGYGGQPPPYTRFPSARAAANDFFLQPGRAAWQETGFSQLSASLWRVTFNYEHGTAYQDIDKAFGSCPDNSAWNGSACVRQNYSCPSTGTWTLSADKLTCTGCRDSSQTLNQDNACVDSKDKDAGESCGESPGSSGSPNPFPPP